MCTYPSAYFGCHGWQEMTVYTGIWVLLLPVTWPAHSHVTFGSAMLWNRAPYWCYEIGPHTRVSARKKFMGGQLENTNLLKKGICLLNTFLKDFTKMPIKKTLFCSLMGGYPPLAKIMRGINPPVPPSVWNPAYWCYGIGPILMWWNGPHTDVMEWGPYRCYEIGSHTDVMK